MYYFNFFVYILVVFKCANRSLLVPSKKYTVCVTSEYVEECRQINKEINDINCIILEDQLSCIEKVREGIVHVTLASSEAAFLVESEANIRMLQITKESDPYDYEIAIFVNRYIANGLKDVQNFSYFFPGIDLTDVNPQLLMEFERVVLFENGRDICANNQLPLLENYIKALHDQFGPLYRPGRWTLDNEIDTALKKKYLNMAARCGVTPYEFNKGMAFTETLNCAIDSRTPAVAVTTLRTIADLRSTHNFTGYTICKNGTISSAMSCGWSGVTNKVIILERDNDFDLLSKLSTWLPEFSEVIKVLDGQHSISNAIYKVKMPNSASLGKYPGIAKHLKQILLPNLIPGEDYEIRISQSTSFEEIRRKRVCVAKQLEECDIKVRWCTTSDDEQRKCEVWSRASLHNGIQPVPSCLQTPSKTECIEAIRTNKTDAVTIDADLAYSANLDNLETIAFLETERESLIRVVLVVKGNIMSLESLKGKKACFPRYGGIPWLSFIDVTRSILLNNETFSYAQVLDDTLGSSCMPGAETLGTKNLCSLCVEKSAFREATCSTDATNKYYGNQGALDCLEEVGDFAVITVVDGLNVPEDVHVMCKNGSLGSRNLNVDDKCFLTIIPVQQIIARQGDPKNLDIQLMLKESERRFLQDRRTPFKLFKPFNAAPNMLFMDTTLGIELPHSENHLVKNVKKLQTVFKSQETLFQHRAGSSILKVHWTLPILILIINFVKSLMLFKYTFT